MPYTVSDLEYFDTILKYCFERKQGMPNFTDLSSLINQSESKSRSLFEKICEEGKNLNLFNIEISGYGDYRIVMFKDHNIQSFLEDGGFSEYFKEKTPNPVPQIVITGNGNSINQGNNNTIGPSTEKVTIPFLSFIKKNKALSLIMLVVLIIVAYPIYNRLKTDDLKYKDFEVKKHDSPVNNNTPQVNTKPSTDTVAIKDSILPTKSTHEKKYTPQKENKSTEVNSYNQSGGQTAGEIINN